MPAVMYSEHNGLAFEAEDFGFDVGKEYVGFSHGESIAKAYCF